CVDCADENNLPTTSECYGLHLCEGARAPEGETPCMCGSHTYYKKCMVNETCFSNKGDTYSANGGYCSDWTYDGRYATGIEKCTKVDGSKLYWHASCTQATDCEGKPGPAYGLTTCTGDKGIGTPVECGGRKYFSSCECSYGNGDTYSANGGYCSDWTYNGRYATDLEKCTKSDGSKVYWYASCTAATTCEGKPGPAYGLTTCTGDKGVGTPVECGGYKYFSSCDCSYGNGDTYSANGGYCSDWTYNGRYATDLEKCTKSDGSKVYWYASCTAATTCEGKPGPAYGLTQCSYGETAIGTVVKCGGYEYGTSCVRKVECSYDYTEEICTKDGKDFVQKCKDNDGKWWGECKDKE
ncbi:MAG: hypothetical protein ACI4OE_03240, partial [Alphaproteobacteria bacterium]